MSIVLFHVMNLIIYIYIFFFFLSIYICFKIVVSLIRNVVLVPGVQQSDSYIYIYIFFSIMVYYRILNITPCAM